MKRVSIAACVLPLILITLPGFAAQPGNDSSKLAIYPKNLARHHMGSSLFEFSDSTKSYMPVNVAGAWMDDDIATGALPATGKHYYLITLAEPQVIENFEIAARDLAGSISLYTADQPAAPGSSEWKPLLGRKPVESALNHRLETPLSRVSRYVLLETNFSAVSPIYSLYLYGDTPAVAFETSKRSSEVDVAAVLGRNVNPGSSISSAGLYTGARITYADANGNNVQWQRAIDDNPETGISLAPSSDSTLLVQMGQEQAVQRISVLTDDGTRGKLEFFLMDEPQNRAEAKPAVLENATPIASITFDGSNPRGSTEFPMTTGRTIAARWTPASGNGSLTLRELNAFGDLTLANHEVANPAAIAERTGDGKSGKELLPPVAEGPTPPPIAEYLPDKSPFLPGALPPKVDIQSVPQETIVLPPEQPLSP